MDYQLKGKVAIVTGGGSGVGAADAKLLMQEGCNVVINYRSHEENVLKYVKELNERYDSKAIAVFGDVSKEEDDKELFRRAIEEFGRVDILINNAGIWPTAFVRDMKVEDFDKTLHVNLLGPFILSQIMVNYCIENNVKGKIINMASQAAFNGSTSGHAHYAASKAGLVAFTISLAREVAQYGITVTAVAPGIVETPMLAEKLNDPASREAYLKRITLRRIATNEDIARIVVFLASSQSDYITGATIDATGGMMMR